MLTGGNLVIVCLERINRIRVSPGPEEFVNDSSKELTPRWEQTPGIVLENPPLLHLCLVIPCKVYSSSCDLSVNLCSWKNFSWSQLGKQNPVTASAMVRQEPRRRRKSAQSFGKGRENSWKTSRVAARRIKFQEPTDGQGGNEEFPGLEFSWFGLGRGWEFFQLLLRQCRIRGWERGRSWGCTDVVAAALSSL